MNKDSVLKYINNNSMLEKGDRVVVGLSGGADSVCLTHVLYSLKDELGITLCAAHINHSIRGDEADSDEQFCRDFCKGLGIEIFVKKADVPSMSRELHIGEEECGRIVRYEFFSAVAGQDGKIATAHNKNDNAETLLLNLVRGSSLKGACAIPPVRGNIIRPLLDVSRSEIEAYIAENKLDFVTDSTNLQTEYARNKIRNEILPLLQSINASAVDNLASFTGYASEDNAYVLKELERVYKETADGEKLISDRFNSLDISLKRRAAERYLKNVLKTDVFSKNIDALIEFSQGGKTAENIGNTKFKKENGYIFPYPEQAKAFKISLKAKELSADYPYGKLKIRRLQTKDLQNIKIMLLDNLIDCDKINDVLILRSRQEGDSFTFGKRGISKSLKKLFNEEKIPLEKRNKIAVLESGGKVVFVEGFGVNKAFKADEHSKNILEITICEENYG